MKNNKRPFNWVIIPILGGTPFLFVWSFILFNCLSFGDAVMGLMCVAGPFYGIIALLWNELEKEIRREMKNHEN